MIVALALFLESKPNYSKIGDCCDSFIGTRSEALMNLAFGPALTEVLTVYFSIKVDLHSYWFSFNDDKMIKPLLVVVNCSSFDWLLDAMVLGIGAVT